jgi:hypothetical protein
MIDSPVSIAGVQNDSLLGRVLFGSLAPSGSRRLNRMNRIDRIGGRSRHE